MHRRTMTVLTFAVTAAAAGAVHGQLIRPDSATASSEFSGSYDIGNTIDGSGLPVGFTLLSTHAPYAANNHWTTRANETVGQFATFTFNTPQTLGQFHFWNHGSNGSIANNPNYEPVLYDLVFFSGPNGGGSTLANLTNLPAQPDLTVAQTRAFNVVSGAQSVMFVVRATQNNNVSPFTGLAEVRFGPCQAPSLTEAGQPQGQGVCPGDTVSFAAVVNGSGPFNYQWQWRQEPSLAWSAVSEGGNGGGSGPALFVAVGSQAPGLTVFPGAGGWSDGGRYRFRVVATGPCGTLESEPALMAIDPADIGTTGGQAGSDGVYDNNDFIAFIDRFFNADPLADLGRVGGVFGPDGLFNNNDFVVFIDRFFTAC